MRRKYIVLSLFAFFLFQMNSFAQRPTNGGQMPELAPNTGAFGGVVIDGISEENIAFANVIAYQTGTQTMVDGTTTNEQGRFMIKNLPYGRYDVIISFIGYEDKKIENQTLSEENRFVKLTKIALEYGSKSLDEVEVTAEKSDITFQLDKKTFNVEKQLNSTGGNAEDVLKNIPSVSFDNDGNVSLRGSSNVRVLINGKPSALTGSSRNAVLQQIPASSIKDVEVLTNPNAKYDPDGTGGIINIITKKQNRQGFNTRVEFNLGTINKYSGSLNLNYRVGKFNMFGNYSGDYKESWREITRDKSQTIYTDSTYSMVDSMFAWNSDSRSENTRISHNIQLGTEYYFSTKSSITGSVTFNPQSRSSEGSGTLDRLDEDGIKQQYTIENDESKDEEMNMEYNLDFNKRFEKEGQELTMGARYSASTEAEEEYEREDFYTLDNIAFDFFGNETMTNENYTNTRLQADYVHPLNNGDKLEMGYQSNIQNINNDYVFNGLDSVSKDYRLSNRFVYDEAVHALYGIFSKKSKKISYSLGVRAEQAYIKADLLDDSADPFVNPYFQLYPSGSINYKLTEKGAIQASYSRRVNRPRSRSLNPFLQVRGPLTYFQGNPELQPEFIDSYEVNYLQFSEKGTFSAGLFYRYTDNIISRLQENNLLTGATTLTWQNLASGQSYGIELVKTFRPNRKVSISANVSAYRSVLNGSNLETDLSNAGYLVTGRVNANFTVWKDLTLQVTGFGRSPGVSIQGRYKSMLSTDISFKKPVLKGKGAITLRFSDPFNTRDFEIDIERPGLEQYFKFKRESRIVYLGFSYSLRQEKRKRGDRRSGSRGQNGGGDFDY